MSLVNVKQSARGDDLICPRDIARLEQWVQRWALSISDAGDAPHIFLLLNDELVDYAENQQRKCACGDFIHCIWGAESRRVTYSKIEFYLI